MSVLNTATVSIHNGELWLTAADAALLVQEGLAAQARENLIAWDKREREFKTREQALVQESNGFNSKWCQSEHNFAISRDRCKEAESAMREYEKTIGDQAEAIAALKAQVAKFSKEKAK